MAIAAPARPQAPATSNTGVVKAWAAVGVLMVAFEAIVLGRWILGSHFVRTATGPDHIRDSTKVLYAALQIIVTGVTLVLMYLWIVRPWRREGRLPVNGMFAIAGGMLFFWDFSMNYTSTSLLYNSNLVNFGAWANGSWPGFLGLNGNRLPEPVFVAIPGYASMVFTQALIILAVLRRVLARKPHLSKLQQAVFIVVGLTILDTIIETLLTRTNLYAYPGAIRAVTLFAGDRHQLPLTETFFFGGLGVGCLAMLMHFRDDRGQTVVERGIDGVRLGERGKQTLRLLAIFGAVHLGFFVLYFVPHNIIAPHSGAWPTGYPSYMTNGMCVYGPQHDQCPGPGVAIPRNDG